MTSEAPRWAKHLPWIDGCAALSAGVLVLVLREVFVHTHGLTRGLLTVIGAVNLAYAIPGLTLGSLEKRPSWLLWLLVGANLAWAVVCVVLVLWVSSSARWLGLGHIVGEGVLVTVLAALEVRYARVILGEGEGAPATSPGAA